MFAEDNLCIGSICTWKYWQQKVNHEHHLYWYSRKQQKMVVLKPADWQLLSKVVATNTDLLWTGHYPQDPQRLPLPPCSVQISPQKEACAGISHPPRAWCQTSQDLIFFLSVGDQHGRWLFCDTAVWKKMKYKSRSESKEDHMYTNMCVHFHWLMLIFLFLVWKGNWSSWGLGAYSSNWFTECRVEGGAKYSVCCHLLPSLINHLSWLEKEGSRKPSQGDKRASKILLLSQIILATKL